MEEAFRKFASGVTVAVGSFWSPVIIAALVFGTGLYFDFSSAWKSNASLVATLAALFLLSFLQHSQNHSDKAAHLKLDELLDAFDGARNEVISAEEKPKSEIEQLKKQS